MLTPEQKSALLQSQSFRELSGIATKTATPVSEDNGADIDAQLKALKERVTAKQQPITPPTYNDEPIKEESIASTMEKYNPLSGLSKGALKTAGQMAVGVGEFGGSILSKLFGGDGKDVKIGADYLREKIGTPEGAMQKTGAFGAEVASLFTPMGEEAAALKLGSYLKNLPKVAGAAKAVVKSAAEGLKFGAQEAAKTGDVEKGVGAGMMAADLGLAGRMVGSAYKGLKNLPGSDKLAEFLTNESKKTYQFAKENPALMKTYKDIAEDTSIIPTYAKKIFDTAKNAGKKVGSAWQKAEGDILSKTEEKIKTGAVNMRSDLRNKAREVLSKEGITFDNGKVVLDGSAFAKNSEAKTFFQNIYEIMKAPVENTQQLLNKGKSISSLMGKDVNPAVKRVGVQLKKELDGYLSTITEGAHGKMKDAYKAGIDPVNKVIEGMSIKNKATGAREFSQDKATAYINQVMSDFKFNKKEALVNLQKQLEGLGMSKENFVKEIQAMGAAKRLSRDNPVTGGTGGRLKDVILSYGITKVPLLAALVSPKFWGGRMTADAATKTASKFTSMILPLATQKMLVDLFKE